MEELLKKIKALEEKVAELEVEVQRQPKGLRKITTGIIILALVTSAGNIISLNSYSQIAKREKVFLQRGEDVLSLIEKQIYLGK